MFVNQHELDILKRICARGRTLFLDKGYSVGVDMFEHMETELGRFAVRHGIELSWDQFNVKEMKAAAQTLRQRAYQLEQEIEQIEQNQNPLEQRRVSDL